MTRIVAYQHGIFPRSEQVVAATRDAERGRTTLDVVEQRIQQDETMFVEAQRSAGLDLYSDGLLRWQDIFRPLVEAGAGMEARTLIRWFDNNSFYRAPEIGGGVAPIGDIGLPAVYGGADSSLPTPRVATLPSPYLFSRAAHTSFDRDELMLDLATHVLRPTVEALLGRGYEAIHLEEPWIPYTGIDDASWGPFEKSLAELRDATGDRAALVLHAYFGDVAPHADRLRHLPVDAVGIDFVETDLEALPRGWDVGVLAGAIDGRRSLVERPEDVAAFAGRVAESLAPPVLYLSSNSELEMLPTDVATAKVVALGAAAAIAKEALR